MKHNKKGNLQAFQGIVLTIMVIGILAGAALLAQTAFRDAVICPDLYSYNAATNLCALDTNASDTTGAFTSEGNATQNWVTSGRNLSSQAPTAGTLFGVGLIVVAAFGIIGFLAVRRQ